MQDSWCTNDRGVYMSKDTNQSIDDKEKAWATGKIVWLATWRGRRARVVSGRAMPNWIHEGGNQVKWKVLEGKEWLQK